MALRFAIFKYRIISGLFEKGVKDEFSTRIRFQCDDKAGSEASGRDGKTDEKHGG
jgi:hypothetical protein